MNTTDCHSECSRHGVEESIPTFALPVQGFFEQTKKQICRYGHNLEVLIFANLSVAAGLIRHGGLRQSSQAEAIFKSSFSDCFNTGPRGQSV